MQMCGLSEKTSSNHQDHLPKQYLQIKTYLLCWSAPRLSLGRNRMSKLEKREEEVTDANVWVNPDRRGALHIWGDSECSD